MLLKLLKFSLHLLHTGLSGLQLICPIYHKRTSQQALSGPESFHLEEIHKGLQKGFAKKKAAPSYSLLNLCALLSYGMSVMLQCHQFGVLIWKFMNTVKSRSQKKNREPQAGHRSFESACENPFLPLQFCSMEVEWHLLPFPFKYSKKSSIEKCIQVFLNSYKYQNNLIHRFLPNVASILIQSL